MKVRELIEILEKRVIEQDIADYDVVIVEPYSDDTLEVERVTVWSDKKIVELDRW